MINSIERIEIGDDVQLKLIYKKSTYLFYKTDIGNDPYNINLHVRSEINNKNNISYIDTGKEIEVITYEIGELLFFNISLFSARLNFEFKKGRDKKDIELIKNFIKELELLFSVVSVDGLS